MLRKSLVLYASTNTNTLALPTVWPSEEWESPFISFQSTTIKYPTVFLKILKRQKRWKMDGNTVGSSLYAMVQHLIILQLLLLTQALMMVVDVSYCSWYLFGFFKLWISYTFLSTSLTQFYSHSRNNWYIHSEVYTHLYTICIEFTPLERAQRHRENWIAKFLAI